MSSKISFTIHRPPGLPSHSSRNVPNYQNVESSDDSDQEDAIELVTAFDQSGVQRLHDKPKPSGPLVIPALANRDWRAIARSRTQQRFIPDGAAAQTGKDGSQGGLGTKDTINSAPQTAGLVLRHTKSEADLERNVVTVEADEQVHRVATQAEATEDERARKALLAGALKDGDEDQMAIEAIPVRDNDFGRPLDETDAYRQDVVTRPDSATLADYERVPVSQFGAALLRGMGWKEGTAASRTRSGMVEPWLPSSRPALLGIGAKERPAEDIPVAGKASKSKSKPEKRYVPLVKIARQDSQQPPSSRSRSRSPDRSRASSRLPSSKSVSPYPSELDRRRSHRERDRMYDDYDRSRRGNDYERRDRDTRSEPDRRKERSDKYRDSDNSRERNDRRSGFRRHSPDGYSRNRSSKY